MSTVEEFRGALPGATATHKKSRRRAMRTYEVERGWATPEGAHLSNEEMVSRGYTLDPIGPRPTSAREALSLAWELAHEVKRGQVIPAGTGFISVKSEIEKAYGMTLCDQVADDFDELHTRTLDPLPGTEPDWLDEPIVLATCECRGMELWQPHNERVGTWECAHCGLELHWSELEDATPLYQKKGQEV